MARYDVKQDVRAHKVLDIGAIMLLEPNKGVSLGCRLLGAIEQCADLQTSNL